MYFKYIENQRIPGKNKLKINVATGDTIHEKREDTRI